VTAVTFAIIANLIIAGVVVLGLLWLLGHQGIFRGVHHDRRATMRMRVKERMGRGRGLSSKHA
jgi:hypothetical protein